MTKLEGFIPRSHPLRPIRKMVNVALVHLAGFLTGMYAAQSQGGRPATAPEKLLHAMLLQVFYSIRSERQLMEQTHYNLLYRWFILLAMDGPVWVPTVFIKNRARLLGARCGD
jgi:transposase